MPIYAPTGFLDVTNATLRGSKIVTTSNVGVANVNPLNTLSVGSNLQVEDTGSNVLTVRGNAAAAAMTLGVITLAPSYSLEIISNIGNTVSNTIQFTNETTGFVSESNIEVGTGNLFVNTSTGLVSVGNALSVSGRADLTDLHASNLTVDGALYANASTGRVGVNTTSPGNFNLDVHGSANVGALTATDVTVTGNLAVAGELTSIRSTTVNVDDPIIGLANNNTSDPAVLDIGFVMARPSTATGSNVAIIFDESSDTLEIGYTTGKHTDTTITIDDSVLFHTNIHGNVAVSNLEVGQFSVVAAHGLDHVTNENNSTGDTIISTNETTGLQTTANISVGRDALVSGNVEVSKELTVSGNAVVSQELTVSGNVEVGTANLFVNTTTGNVGVGTTTPGASLEVSGNVVVSSNLEVGTANLFVDTTTGNVGIGSTIPTAKLDLVGGKINGYPVVSASGGTETTSGNYKIHTFTTSANFTVSTPGMIEFLLVAGGGGGGTRVGGGGGGGGVMQRWVYVGTGTHAIQIGAGGGGSTSHFNAGSNGTDTTFINYTAKGGGGGESSSDYNEKGNDGGSGGGGLYDRPGGHAMYQQGHIGTLKGYGVNPGVSPATGQERSYGGNGGGGGGREGYPCFFTSTDNVNGGAGGDGFLSSISGSDTYYAGGGGGSLSSLSSGSAGAGGSGGGGAGGKGSNGDGTNGTANTGGGGGGGGFTGPSNANGGSGGSGIAIIRYIIS